MSDQPITVSARINKPIIETWDIYTQPQHITGWNFASDDWCCPSAENDLRVGGAYRARMEAKDGTMGFDYEATYSEVVPQARLVSAMPNGRDVVTTFEAEGDGTLVTTTFVPETEHSVHMQRAGWQAILDNFKAYAEGL